jgi:hypothetical protein
VVHVSDDGDIANIFIHVRLSVLRQKGLLKQPAARTKPFLHQIQVWFTIYYFSRAVQADQ